MSHRTLESRILNNKFLSQTKMQKSDWGYLSPFSRKKLFSTSVFSTSVQSLLFFTIYHLGRRRQNYRSHRVRHCWWWLTRRGSQYRCNQEHSVLHGHHVVNQMNASNVICFASKTSIKRTLSIKQGSLPFFNPQPSTVTQISPLISDTQIDGE